MQDRASEGRRLRGTPKGGLDGATNGGAASGTTVRDADFDGPEDLNLGAGAGDVVGLISGGVGLREREPAVVDEGAATGLAGGVVGEVASVGVGRGALYVERSSADSVAVGNLHRVQLNVAVAREEGAAVAVRTLAVVDNEADEAGRASSEGESRATSALDGGALNPLSGTVVRPTTESALIIPENHHLHRQHKGEEREDDAPDAHFRSAEADVGVAFALVGAHVEDDPSAAASQSVKALLDGGERALEGSHACGAAHRLVTSAGLDPSRRCLGLCLDEANEEEASNAQAEEDRSAHG